jgi:hypothetical protein
MARTDPTTPMCDGDLLQRFEPTARDSDVFITTTPKCGQTWLQTLLFHIKTAGRKPDFGGVGLGGVSPWLEIPADFGVGPTWSSPEERMAQFEALPDPRVFKLHVIWDEVPRPPGSKSKVITITRDPRDVPYSMFSHMQAMKPSQKMPTPSEFDTFFEEWLARGLYFQFIDSFWQHKDDPSFLWLRYEDLQRDLRGQTARILAFLGWKVAAEDLERALPLVDFEHLRTTEKSQVFSHAVSRFKEEGRFFREGGMGKNRARLSEDQQQRLLARLRAALPEACCARVLALDA